MRTLRVALGMLTTLPFPAPADWKPGESGRAAAWFPLVGLGIGGLTWLGWTLVLRLFPAPVAGVLTLGIWVALSGGLHLDGLADCCDGLFASATPARRLEIMKDPRLGAFGVTGLVVVLILKAAALATLPGPQGMGIILAAALGRWCILPAGLLPPAHPAGLGADFVAGLQRRSLLWAGILPLACALLLGFRGMLATLAGLVVTGLILAFAKSKIGGVTGDVFGCIVEIVEVVVLLGFVASAH